MSPHFQKQIKALNIIFSVKERIFCIKFCDGILNFRVVVISEGNPPETLTQMNSVIRRIDLTCKLFAPVVSGFIISFASLKASAVTLACWNMVSLWLQYWLLVSVFRGIPALRESNQKRVVGTPSSNQEIAVSVSEERVICHSGICIMTEDSHWLRRNLEKILQSSFASSWRIYLEQETVLPGVALALLYFTVLR